MMGWNDRDERIAVFEDTMSMCKQNERLRASIQFSIQAQRLIREEDGIEGAFEGAFGGRVFDKIDKIDKIDKGLNGAASEDKEPSSASDSDASIVVSKKRTFEAAQAYARTQKVCVLNFASATNPGGGVKKGSSAQEECLCRCSTLYPCISDHTVRHGFHDRHKSMISAGRLNALYNDDCIYTPGVVVFKSDSSAPRTMPEQEWYLVDVITCAAPNLRAKPSNSMNPASGSEAVKISNVDLMALHEKRANRILDLAKANGAETIVLGAFGCGAFQNPPEVVAAGICKAVRQHRRDFRTIEFAVFCRPGDTANYESFRRMLEAV